MRVTEYSVLLQDGVPSLVKEKAVNYSTIERIKSPQDVVSVMRDIFCADVRAEEHVWMMSLKSNLLKGVFELSHGNDSSCYCSSVSIFKRLLLSGGTEFILIHNHPSKYCKPSKEDIDATKKIMIISKLMEVQLLDHIIIGPENKSCSFKENQCVL